MMIFIMSYATVPGTKLRVVQMSLAKRHETQNNSMYRVHLSHPRDAFYLLPIASSACVPYAHWLFAANFPALVDLPAGVGAGFHFAGM